MSLKNVCIGAHRGQKRALNLLVLEFTSVIRYLAGMLKTTLWSSARAVCTFSYWVISSKSCPECSQAHIPVYIFLGIAHMTDRRDYMWHRSFSSSFSVLLHPFSYAIRCLSCIAPESSIILMLCFLSFSIKHIDLWCVSEWIFPLQFPRKW